MNEHYPSLYQLLAQNQQAKSYFLDLPDYVRDQIEMNSQNFSSIQDLQGYVNQIMNRSLYQ